MRCRAKYEHLERYADYFGIPAGVMLLITRVTASLRYSHRPNSPPEYAELRELSNGISGLREIVSDPERLSSLMAAIRPEEPATWDGVFDVLTQAFLSSISNPEILKNASRRRLS